MAEKAPAAILVTGGSGFVGQNVVRKLAEGGRTIVAIYHHKLPETRENVYPVCADISSPELMAAPLRGVDTVVHLAWEGGLEGPQSTIPQLLNAKQDLTANTRMIRNLLTAMERAGTKRLVFVSALGASRQSTVPFLQEKYLAEWMVLNSKIPEKVILRSAVVWGGQGRNDRFVNTLIRVMKYPVYPLPRKTGGIAPLHVLDLADLIVNSCSCPISGSASLLDVPGGANYPLQEVFKIVSENYVKRTRFAVGGMIGESLLPLLERDRRSEPRRPKLQQFLAIGASSDERTELRNELTKALPKQLATFKERIMD